jgi:hypothetical protein
MTEIQKINRHLTNAKRELLKAVERTSECSVDLLPGHLVEAKRRALAVEEEAAKLVDALSEG